jgi:hypothetical protein
MRQVTAAVTFASETLSPTVDDPEPDSEAMAQSLIWTARPQPSWNPSFQPVAPGSYWHRHRRQFVAGLSMGLVVDLLN